MKKTNALKKDTFARRKTRTGVILVAAGLFITVGILTVLLFGPSIEARAVLRRALREAESFDDGRLVLCDPYVEGALLPVTRDVTETGERAQETLSLLQRALVSPVYRETKSMPTGNWMPYLCIQNTNSVVFFYLEEDSVWVKKNSTYYRFSPRSTEEQSVYAELYDYVTACVSQEVTE